MPNEQPFKKTKYHTLGLPFQKHLTKYQGINFFISPPVSISSLHVQIFAHCFMSIDLFNVFCMFYSGKRVLKWGIYSGLFYWASSISFFHNQEWRLHYHWPWKMHLCYGTLSNIVYYCRDYANNILTVNLSLPKLTKALKRFIYGVIVLFTNCLTEWALESAIK